MAPSFAFFMLFHLSLTNTNEHISMDYSILVLATSILLLPSESRSDKLRFCFY